MKNYHQLASLLEDAIDSVDDVRSQQKIRMQWAKERISGVAVSKYVVDCISGKEITPPWY